MLKPRFSRGTHTFDFPLLLSHDPRTWRVLLGAYVLPPLTIYVTKRHIIRPWRRWRKARQVTHLLCCFISCNLALSCMPHPTGCRPRLVYSALLMLCCLVIARCICCVLAFCACLPTGWRLRKCCARYRNRGKVFQCSAWKWSSHIVVYMNMKRI